MAKDRKVEKPHRAIMDGWSLGSDFSHHGRVLGIKVMCLQWDSRGCKQEEIEAKEEDQAIA